MSKNSAQLQPKQHEELFFGVHGIFSGKNLSHPQNFACSYTHVLHHHICKDFVVLF